MRHRRTALGILVAILTVHLVLPAAAEEAPAPGADPAAAADDAAGPTVVGLTLNSRQASVGGSEVSLDVPPQQVDGQIMLPLRFLASALGAGIDFDPATRAVTVTLGSRAVVLQPGSTRARVNLEPAALEVPPVIVQGRTLVPVSFVRAHLGFQVRVDEADGSVLLVRGEVAADVDAVGPRALDQAQLRRLIGLSYRRALGRDPTAAEMNWWLGVVPKYGWLANVDALVGQHRQWLRTNAYTSAGAEVAERAYRAVYGRPPNPDERRGAMDWISRDAEIYETLVQRLTRAKANQQAAADSARRQQAEAAVDLAYRQLLQRAPDDAGRRHYVNLMMMSGWSVEDVWTSIARSQERLDRFGHWAPARVSYNGKREQCFGAIGPRCDGAPGTPAPEFVNRFRRPDGVEMGWIRIAVAPGSILHDNICLRQPLGAWCSGWPTVPAHELPLIKAVMPAAMEWNKAVYNVIDGRYWIEDFGPYPVDAGLRAEFSDDLTPVPNRPSFMAPVGVVLGVGALPWNFVRYTQGETRRTRALAAPAGKAVDRGDEQFCRSGSYREEANWWLQKFWGICN